MSRSIDERIVSMSFDNKQFEKNASQTLGTLSKLKSATTFTGAISGLTNISKIASKFNLDSISESVLKVREGFSALEIAGITAISNIANKAVNAGLSIAKSLTLDQPIQGFNKYTQKTSSVQTLMNSTGKSVEEVNEYLNRLMWYSDETSFGFTDMTSALSTMVSSGGNIEKLIPMIMGMGNAVAYAGKGASEFSRVIYNLNQSYSAGYLTTMDWRSVQLAGASSKQLQQYLINAAESIGTIQKGTGDISKFASYLSDKKITSEAMEIAFNNFAAYTTAVEEAVNNGTYANATEAMEKMSIDGFDSVAVSAMEAAQNYKSFSEAIDAAKDAAGTAWMKVFEDIFGNFEESKALWTRVGEDLYDLFVSPLNGITELSSSWKELWAEQQKIATDNSITLMAKDTLDVLDYVSQTEALYAGLSSVFREIGSNISRGISNSNLSVSAKSIFNTIERLRDGLTDIKQFLSTNMSGVTKTITTVANSLNTVLNISKTITNYLIKPLLSQFKPILVDANSIIYNIASALGLVGDSVDKSLPTFADLLSKIVEKATPLVSFLGRIVSKLKDISLYIYGKTFKTLTGDVEESANSFNLFSTILDGVGKAIEKISNFFSSFKNALSGIGSVVGKLVDSLKSVAKSVGNVFTSFLDSNGSSLASAAGGGIFAVLLLNLTGFISKLKGLSGKSSKILDNIINMTGDEGNSLTNIIKAVGGGISEGLSNAIKNISDALTDMTKAKINTDMIKAIGLALIEIAAALLIVSSIDTVKMQDAVLAISVVVLELVTAIAMLNTFDKGSSKSVSTIKAIGASLLLISVALKVLSGLDTEQLQNGVLALSAMLVVMSAATGILMDVASRLDEKKAKNIKQVSSIMKSIGFALLEFAVAIRIVSGLSLSEAAIGVGSLSVIIGVLVGCALLMEKHQASFQTFGGTSALLGIGLIGMAAALKIASTMSWDKALVGVLSLSATVLALVATSLLIKDNAASFAAMSASMLLLSPALLVLSAALKLLSTMSWDQALVAVGSLAIMLAAIAVFSNFAGPLLLVAPALLILSAALVVLTGVITILGELKWETIAAGLKALAASLAVIAGMGALLGIVSPLLILAAAGLTVFSGALMVMAKAMIAVAKATVIFSLFKESVSKNMLDFLTSAAAAIVQVIPALILGIVEAVINCASKLVLLVGTLIQIICTAIKDNLPLLVETALLALDQLLTGIVGASEKIFDAGLEILLYFLQGISDNISQVIDLGSEIIQKLIEGISNEIPELANSLLEGFTTVINGLADAIENNDEELGTAFGRLGAAIIKGAITGLVSAVTTFGSELWEGAKNIGSKIAEFFSDPNGGQEQANTSGKNVVEGISTGMEENESTLTTSANTIGTNLTDTLDRSEDAIVSGKDTLNGLISGLSNEEMLNQIYQSGIIAGSKFNEGYKFALDQHSPSREMFKNAKYTIMGLVNGFKESIGDVKSEGNLVGSSILNAIKNSLALSESIMDDELNPVITPVLDLSNIQYGTSAISGLLNSNSLVTPVGDLLNQNGASSRYGNNITLNVDFSVNNAGRDLTESDVLKFSTQIADKINEQLGFLL